VKEEKTVAASAQPAERKFPPVAAQEKSRAEKGKQLRREKETGRKPCSPPGNREKGRIFSFLLRSPESRPVKEQRQEQKPVPEQKPWNRKH